MNNCPNCGSTKIYGGDYDEADYDHEQDEYIFRYWCGTCNCTWNRFYTYTGARITSEEVD